ncbi:MAG: ISKra4 family transposase, partial [Gammaproteobacteria bacterium]|nr:ISKra4 family transposase [Gammaproteobacteria bacterium]MBU1655483.1 ISKra4 family transposase [Gammaproteobacteria bacterium]MBU1961051.1 ISKra4 family transposase [Gammaproteobacteria bacterium]
MDLVTLERQGMQYLTFGYPVASGVIEGACRTVIKDRMERSGMRWVFDGAHAMMGLRSIHLSGLWDEYLAYQVSTELQNLY